METGSRIISRKKTSEEMKIYGPENIYVYRRTGNMFSHDRDNVDRVGANERRVTLSKKHKSHKHT